MEFVDEDGRKVRLIPLDFVIKPENLREDFLSSNGSLDLIRTSRSRRWLSFRAAFYMGYGVNSALRAIGRINRFEADIVIEALATLASHEQLGSRVEIGMEGTPVIYLTLNDKADAKLCEQVLRGAAADEVTLRTEDTGRRTIRAWWD